MVNEKVKQREENFVRLLNCQLHSAQTQHYTHCATTLYIKLSVIKYVPVATWGNLSMLILFKSS